MSLVAMDFTTSWNELSGIKQFITVQLLNRLPRPIAILSMNRNILSNTFIPRRTLPDNMDEGGLVIFQFSETLEQLQ